MSGRIIIGLGTGRCGTRSLTKLFKSWGIPATHEKYRLFWKPDIQRFNDALCNLKSDVGFYWLPYVEILLDRRPNTKFVCLKREKEKVVASFMRGTNHPVFCLLIWTKKLKEGSKVFKYSEYVTKEMLEAMDDSTREFVEAAWDMEMATEWVVQKDHFPLYPLDNQEECIKMFWDEYYTKSEELCAKYPDNFMLIDMDEALNTNDGRNKIKNFIGVCPNTQAQ